MDALKPRSIEANGLRFAYLEQGEGPLVLLLHGFPDNARTWSAQMSALAGAGYRVVAPYLRGYPPSEIPADGCYDVTTLGTDLVALIAALGDGEPAFVVGHDFGSMMIYAGAVQSPGSFRSATVLAVPHPITFPLIALTPELVQHSFHLWFFAHRGIGEAGAAHEDMRLIDHIWDYWTPDGADNMEHIEQVKAETLNVSGGLAAAIAYYPQLVGTPEQPGLPESLLEPTPVPMLALYGADDPIPPVTATGEEQFFPAGYRREDIADARHFVHRDAPEAVSRILLEWFGAGNGQRK